MLNFVDCVQAPLGEGEAREAPAVAGQSVAGDSDRAPAEREEGMSSSRGRVFPLRLLPRRQQLQAEQARAKAALATAELYDSVAQAADRAPEKEPQAAAGEGALRGTLQALAQAGGYAGALVLEALQGVGSLQMGPMGSLPMASVNHSSL